MDEAAIKVENLSKAFRLPHEKTTSLKSVFINFYRRKKSYEMQQALKNVSFEVKKGEFFGIVGRNGSGKSTLLKLLAGIYMPTNGEVHVSGSLTPFIELGVGFNPELTGRENVFLNSALLGFNRKEMRDMYIDIVRFAELEKVMNQKLKNYSSGMQVRLAFSIAIRAKPDILIVDEVLAVGDAAFQQKCYDYFRELKKNKQTVVFVSHDRSALENFCDRCILIDNGGVIALGRTPDVLQKYNKITLEQMSTGGGATKGKKRWGTKDIEITGAAIVGKTSNTFSPREMIKLQVEIKSQMPTENPIYGLTIKRSGGAAVLTTNTKAENIKTGKLRAGTKVCVVYEVENIFGNGEYEVSPAVANEDGTIFYDWREGLLKFVVSGWDDTYSDLHPSHTIKIEGPQ